MAGLLAASCTSSSDVAEVESNTGPETTAEPGTTPAPTTVDGSTPVTAPDPNGLPSISEPDPAIVIGELDNGLRYLIRDNDNPGARVDMRLVVDAGSALEDETQSGGAHFLEHMLFNGTEQFPENELIDVLRSFGAAFGADINAYTTYDETVYELTMPTADDAVVETGLDVLEQWLSAATIEQVQVEAERGVVLDEWRGSEASSDGRIFDGLEELFLTGSPYEGHDPIGDEAAITGMNAEPLRAFYDDWYRPDNAAVVVVGDIDPEAIEQGLVDRFGPLVARGTSPERPELLVEPSTEPQVVVVSDPDVAEGFAQVTLPTHSRRRRVARGDAAGLDSRRDGLRHRRHEARQRRPARRGAVRRCPGRFQRVRPRPRGPGDRGVGRWCRTGGIHAGGVRRVRASAALRFHPGRGRSGRVVDPNVGRHVLRRTRLTPGRRLRRRVRPPRLDRRADPDRRRQLRHHQCDPRSGDAGDRRLRLREPARRHGRPRHGGRARERSRCAPG